MKQQITRLSPHQNAKVVGVLALVVSLVFFIPLALVAYTVVPPEERPAMFFFLVMPFVYLVMGYVVVVIGCSIYNALVKRIGGIEFETREVDG
ncbi:MAG: hypothetical protein KGL68_14825 [Burkholderiales bacterium]|nr:hypothetical protein [Burkholderiales bacterium]